jgi:uncharacterized protein (DUF58 family)
VITSPTRHLTALIALPLVVASALYALTILTGNAWFTVLAGAPVGLLLASLAARPRLDGLELCVSGPVRAAVGETVVHTLHVHNRSERRSPPLDVRQEHRGLAAVSIHVEPLPPGGRAVVDLSRVALSRGVTDTCYVSVSAVAGFGMTCTHSRGDYARRLVIHPRPVPHAVSHDLAIRDDLVDPAPGPGTDISGVREWRPGDAAGSVHWRSTARRGTLVVRERATSATRHLVVAMVCDDDATDWEAVVAAAAGVCRAAQVAGDGLTLLVWNDGRLIGDAPVHSVPALLDWWAALAGSEIPAAAALAGAVATLGATDVLLAMSAQTHEARYDEFRRALLGHGVTARRLPVPA